MKNTLLFVLLLVSSHLVFGQNAYIQVNGEAGLSVFLNSQFKGKTTTEFNGLIIENVIPGKNLIKVVKEGFTPFEETITVKSGEVFSYTVKPFTKHLVNISEQGNSGETDKKATIQTGKLIVQSVPIEIKITIPDIEGVDNLPKTKDKWSADKIPAGTYDITFTYNQKVISKTIEIVGNDTTSVFINMLNGEFNAVNSLDKKRALEQQEYLNQLKMSKFIDSLATANGFKRGLTEAAFKSFNPEASSILIPVKRHKVTDHYTTYMNMNDKLGINIINIQDGIVTRYKKMVVDEKESSQSQLYFSTLLESVKKNIPSQYIRHYVNQDKSYQSITFTYNNMKVEIDYYIHSANEKYETSSISITFHVIE